MHPILSTAQTLASRRCLHPPPQGTSSRILSVRLRRFFHRTWTSNTSSPNWIGGKDDAPKPTYPKFPKPPKVPRTKKDGAGVVRKVLVGSPSIPRETSRAATINDLFEAVRVQNTRKVWTTLVGLCQDSQPDELKAILRSIPPPTFTEILRSLDPIRVGASLDPAHGINITKGIGQFSAVASTVDRHGIRKTYKSLLSTMFSVLQSRLEAGYHPIVSDYVVLLRCAGAASDARLAKEIWKMMDITGTADIRQGQAYDEFIKARFLTEPLYAQNDLSRFRVRPLNFHKRKTRIQQPSRRRLEKLRLSTRAYQSSHYGLDPQNPTHDLHRITSLPAPIRRVWFNLLSQGVHPDEKLYCSFMIASAQAGSFSDIVSLALWRGFRIRVVNHKNPRDAQIVGASHSRLDSPLRPTAILMDAIVQSLGTTANVILAKRLVEYISRRYSIPIPHRTWSKLLEWTYICSTAPCSIEWKLFGDMSKVTRATDVLAVWDTMTSDAYRIKPTFQDLNLYVRALIEAGLFQQARQNMRLGISHYEQLCQELEEALLERLHPARPSTSLRRHLRAKAVKHHAWYNIQGWCQKWLSKATRRRSLRNGDFSAIVIPDFVDEFRDFMPDPISYRTSSGTVRITEPGNPRFRWVKGIVHAPTTPLRIPNRGNAIQDADGVPMLTASGEPIYRNKTINISRRTRRLVRRRTQKWFGQAENHLVTELQTTHVVSVEKVAAALEW